MERHPRALLLADDVQIAASTALALTSVGYRVDVAESASRAVEQVLRSRYDVALVDDPISGRDGLDVCRQLRQLQPGLAMILLASDANLDRIEAALGAGVRRVLPRPVDIEEQVAAVGELLGELAPSPFTGPPTPTWPRGGAIELLEIVWTAVEQSSDGIVITTPQLDLPGPQIVYANSAFTRITGYEVHEVIGRTPRILQGPKTNRAVLDRLRRCLEREEQFFGETINYRKDGTEFWIEWHIAPVRDARGRLTHWIAVQRDVTAQRADREALHRANEALRDEVEQRRAVERELRLEQDLLRAMFQAQEQEQKLISFDIHDGVVQYAVGALMHLEGCIHNAGDAVPVAELEALPDHLRRVVDEARRVMRRMRPIVLDERGVVVAIEYLIAEQPHDGPEVELHVRKPFDRLEPSLETTIYRIVQEGLNNARRHSRSDKVEIRLDHPPGAVHIEIEDWGVGFDPTAVADGHFGLRGMRERARLLGGLVAIDSAPGRGTRTTVDLPIKSGG